MYLVTENPSQSPIYPIGEWIGSVLPSRTQVPEVGVIPVDMIEITDITILSSEKGEGDFGKKPKPKPIQMFGGGGKWTKMADMPTARDGSASVVNGKIYVIGGVNNDGVISATIEAYDPVTDTWGKKADMPAARGGSASVVNGKIYVIGGTTDFFNTLPTVEAYDPVTDTWGKKADMPTARKNFSTSVVNGKIYAIGGGVGFPVSEVLSTVEEYDVMTGIWTKKADMPIPRYGLSTAVVNGKIYAIGGWNGSLNNLVLPHPVHVYDPVTDTWGEGVDLPTARAFAPTGVVNGKIYVIGGWRPDESLSTVEAFTTETTTNIKPAEKLTTTWGQIKNTQ